MLTRLGRASTPVVPAADVFIFAGQSNMVAFGTVGSSAPTNITTLGAACKIWNWLTHAWETYVPGTNSETDDSAPHTPQLYGPDGEFARQWLADNPGKTCYLFKRAENGTQLASTGSGAVKDWSPSSTGEYFDNVTAELALAKAALVTAGLTPKVRLVNWGQGETDGQDTTKASNYNTNLTAFVTAALSTWGDASTMMNIMRISNSTAWTFGSTVRAAQAAVVAANPTKLKLIDTDSFVIAADNQHYVAPAVASLGALFYQAYALPAYDVTPAAKVTLGTMVAAVNTADVATYAFTNLDFGAVANNRRALISISRRPGGGVIQAVMANNRPAYPIDSTSSGATNKTALYMVDLPGGSRFGDVTVFLNAADSRCGISITPFYGGLNVPNGTDLKASGDPSSGSITVLSGGAVVGVSMGTFGTVATGTWAGVTKRFDQAIESTIVFSGACDEFVSGASPTISFDWAGTPADAPHLIAVALSPQI